MADHGEVQYAPATADDYPEHAESYRTFVKLIEVLVPTIAAIVVSLGLIGVKAAGALGVVILIAAHIAAVIGFFSRSSWRAPAVVLVIALIALAVT
jgi:hypothetical protein